jgi:hypothetical protein
MRVILADYLLTSTFRVPKGVPLLEENENICDKAWSWWIKWDTLHYIDDKGVEHTIEAYCSASDDGFKRPDKVEMEDEDTDDDE